MSRRRMRIAGTVCLVAAGLVLAAAVASLWVAIGMFDRVAACSGAAVLVLDQALDAPTLVFIPLEGYEWRLRYRTATTGWWPGPPTRDVVLPLWPFVLALAAMGVVLRGRGKERQAGTCARCGYDLTGNVSGVCPECGTNVGGLRGAERGP